MAVMVEVFVSREAHKRVEHGITEMWSEDGANSPEWAIEGNKEK